MERLSYSPARARVWAALLVGFLAAVSVGCQDTSQPVARKNSLTPAGPEESFQRILDRLKRRLEQGPRQVISAGLDADSNATSSFSLQDKVSGEVFPPGQEGDPYRAEVIIRTHSDYVHTRTVPEPVIEKPKDDDTDSILARMEEGGESADGEDPLLSPELALSEDPLGSSSDETTARNAKPGTQTLTDPFDDINSYLLVYQDGRWALEEPIEEENEALKLVFEHALEVQ